jgi:hypothetical protein
MRNNNNALYTSAQSIPAQLRTPAPPHPVNHPLFLLPTQLRIFKIAHVFEETFPKARAWWKVIGGIITEMAEGKDDKTVCERGKKIGLCK